MASSDGAVVIKGFTELQRALRRIQDGTQQEVKVRIRAIGEHVAATARGNVPHKTGRHGEGPTIEAGMKVSVQQRGASVYTTAPHGGAINVGANVGHRRGVHINRADASHYMDRAVDSSQAFVEQEITAVLDWLTTTFQE